MALRVQAGCMAQPVRLIEPTPVRLLPLAYGDVDVHILHEVEKVCRLHGVRLEQIELLGQDTQACIDFLHVARVVGVEAALLSTDWLSLEATLSERSRSS